MIEVRSVSATIGPDRLPVLRDLSAQFEARTNYVILGAKGSGKTTLLEILCGTMKPDRGSVVRYGTVGLPVGHSRVRSGWDSGRRISTFLAELYGADPREVVGFVSDFADVPDKMDTPLGDLDRLSRLRLSFALAYAIPVDCFLFENTVYARGEEAFRQRCLRAFEERRREAATILITRQTDRAEQYGERGGVLHNGQLELFASVREAIEAFDEHQHSSQLGTLDFARTLLSKGEFEAARTYARHFYETFPDNREAVELLAGLCLRAGDLPEATAIAKRGLVAFPESSDLHVVLARAAEREKRHDDAIEHAQDALELNPGDRSAAALLAKAHSAVGSQEEAATRWRAFTRESPDSLRAWTRTIRAEAKAEHWPQVLDTIQKASQATGAAEPWEELRARALLECGRIDELKQSLRALARTNLEKTLRIIWRAAAGEDVALTAGLLKALDLRRLESEPPSRTLRNIQRMLEERVPALTGRDLQETTLSELVDLAVGSSQPRAADNAAVHR